MSIYEINMENKVEDRGTRIREKSVISEVFSSLTAGKNPGVSAAEKDQAVKTIKEIGSKANEGDQTAKSEINDLIRFAIQPKLLDAVKLFNFMGSYKQIGYRDTPMMRTYKYESVDSRFQAGSGDVPFGAYSFREYPIATQTISGGFAVDYREIESGNFDGNVPEGMNQVKIDMENKMVYYAIKSLYDAIKNNTGAVKHFAESAGIAKTGVDDMMKVMRHYGHVNICGDYSVVSQFNDFVGYKQANDTTIGFGADAVAEEIRKTGLVSAYNGSYVTELPNAINWTKLDKTGKEYELYMPQGLLFFIPQGAISPLQVFLRGGMTSMTGTDVVTRQEITRFDCELGAGVAEGMEDRIGLISDTNFEVPKI